MENIFFDTLHPWSEIFQEYLDREINLIWNFSSSHIECMSACYVWKKEYFAAFIFESWRVGVCSPRDCSKVILFLRWEHNSYNVHNMHNVHIAIPKIQSSNEQLNAQFLVKVLPVGRMACAVFLQWHICEVFCILIVGLFCNNVSLIFFCIFNSAFAGNLFYPSLSAWAVKHD